MGADAAGFTGDIPDFYDRGLGPAVFSDHAAEIARRAAAHAPARVLETAAGTGIVTRALRDRLPAAARLTATDLNPPMLAVARRKFRPEERVEFQPADATALPFPDGSFDLVLCQFGVMFFPDKEGSFREAHRVLAPGGRHLFSVWDSHRHNAFGRIAHEVIGSFFPAAPPQFYQVPFGCHRIDPIKEALTEAGFGGLSIAVVRMEKSIPDLPLFARGLVFGNPVIDQIRAQDGADPERIVAAVTAALRAEFGAEPARMSMQASLFEAQRA
jgi:ubiquinone/menaquinone biosynthesis C-methylase UbiE